MIKSKIYKVKKSGDINATPYLRPVKPATEKQESLFLYHAININTM
jgi:hypothetical protein